MNPSTESKIESLVLEHLRHIRKAVDRIDQNVSELRGRVGHLGEHIASLHSVYAGLQHVSTASTFDLNRSRSGWNLQRSGADATTRE